MISFKHFKAAATDSAHIIVGHLVPDYDYIFKWRTFNTAKLFVVTRRRSGDRTFGEGELVAPTELR